MRLPVLATALLLVASGALAQPQASPPQQPGAAHPDQTSPRGAAAQAGKLADADVATAPIPEQKKLTRHSVTIGGRPIAYDATAGTLTIRDDDGKPTASVFYVAYTTGGARRPVTFFYNGGPGSPTMWLHLGSFGPVRVKTASPDVTAPPPFDIGPNPDSLIDKTDMVFIDAIGAGLSRPVGDAKGKDFWGVDQDADAFARAIIRYITVNSRWNSPKVIFGESYGTLRSGALAWQLQDRGVQLNGVVLLSSILNYGVRDAGFDTIYLTYLPSYAATAWYHNRVANRPADLATYLTEVRAWTRGPYATALAKGQDIPAAEEDQIARQMSAYTGLSVPFLKENNLRVDLSRFRKELLRDQRRTVGRLDSRFLGIDADAGGESPEDDPASTAITGAYMAATNAWIRDDLGYQTDMVYRPSAGPAIQVWDWHHTPPGSRRPANTPDTALDLAATMRVNPHLKVYSLNGYYDMATPFAGTEYDLSHMMLEPELRGNVRYAYYPSGHMVYLHDPSLKQMKADLAKFYDEVAR